LLKRAGSSDRTLAIIVGIIAIGGPLWLLAVFGLWLLLQAAGVMIDFWVMVAGLSSAFASVGILATGFAAYRSLAEMSSSRHMEVADRLFRHINSPEEVEARRWIFENLPPNPEEGVRALTPEGQDAVKRVLNSLDRVAFLTQAGWIPEEMIMPWMNPMIVKAWTKLEPYVRYEGERRQEPDYYEHARELAERCLVWRAENLPEAEITWIDDAL
jgi:hypothetical protein